MKHGALISLLIGMAAALTAAAAMSSCDGRTVFYSYLHTPLSGWEKNDTLKYSIPRQREPGRFNEEIGMRITDDYPFTSITLIVEQSIYPGKRKRTDTLRCNFSDRRGNIRSRGIGHYQYSFSLGHIDLRRNDSLQLNIRHAMKREILPGIADVGFKMVQE